MLTRLRNKAKELGAVEFGRSDRGKKKYYVVLPDGHRVDFGHRDYEDYTTHRDPERRERYLARARAIRNKEGKLTRNDKHSPNYWAINLLW